MELKVRYVSGLAITVSRFNQLVSPNNSGGIPLFCGSLCQVQFTVSSYPIHIVNLGCKHERASHEDFSMEVEPHQVVIPRFIKRVESLYACIP